MATRVAAGLARADPEHRAARRADSRSMGGDVGWLLAVVRRGGAHPVCHGASYRAYPLASEICQCAMGDDHRADTATARPVPAGLAGLAHRQRRRHSAGEPGRRAARAARRGIAALFQLWRDTAVAGAYRNGWRDALPRMAECPAAGGMDAARAARLEHRHRDAGCGVAVAAARLSGTLAGSPAAVADVPEQAGTSGTGSVAPDRLRCRAGPGCRRTDPQSRAAL